ncbi:unnamed protein product [Rotaria sp. Silwood1]|nr:unnamed protein product [Rotaria sp. Silwood1]CAF1687787.1 unnamed protein product [Rotaria sp. Silwood1]
MSVSKTEVTDHSTTNNVEHTTLSSTFTDESIHSTDSDISNATSINGKETHQNSLSNNDVDELAGRLGALDYSKYPLDQQDSTSEHIQHDHPAQIPHEQDTTMEYLKSSTPPSSNSVINNENHSSENSPLIDIHEYPPHLVAIVEQQELAPQNSQYVTIGNWSSYETSSEESITVQQIKQLMQRLAAENTAYAYDVPHVTTIIKDPYVDDAHSNPNLASNEYVIDIDPIVSTGNDHLQMTHMEPTHFSSIKNHYYDSKVIDLNINSEPPIIYETNDELNASQLIVDENGEYIDIGAEEIIVSEKYYPNTNDVYQSNVLHEEYVHN